MKYEKNMQILILLSSIIISLAIGYAAGKAQILKGKKVSPDKRVTGIGGIFFKSKDPGKLKQWYAAHLGLVTDEYGTTFAWRHMDNETRTGYTIWSPFKENTTYFHPSEKEFMINYRVENMDELIAKLKNEGIETTDSVESFDYGKFVHIMDPEGNKIELWQPIDAVFEKGLKDKVTY